MALVTYERSPMIDSQTSRVLADNGFIDLSNAPFLGQLIGVFKESVKAPYGQLYDIAKNVDLGRARGAYLDRFGNLIDEGRGMISFAMDLTLSNAVIYLDPNITAGEITSDGLGIPISKGKLLSSQNGEYELQTIDDLYILPDRSTVYARVISLREGATFIPELAIRNIDLQLSELDNVLPSAVGKYTLRATNLSSISGGEVEADDETYRYILKEKTQSIGLLNENKIRTLMDIQDVVSIYIREYFGGVDVYVETSNILINDAVIEVFRAKLQGIRHFGNAINVFGPLTRSCKMTVQIELASDAKVDTSIAGLKSRLVTTINEMHMGDIIDLNQIISLEKQADTFIVGAKLRAFTYGGRVLTGTRIGQHFNEKAYITENDITVIT